MQPEPNVGTLSGRRETHVVSAYLSNGMRLRTGGTLFISVDNYLR